MSKNSLAPRRPCKGRGTACGGRVGGESHEVARGLFSSAFTIALASSAMGEPYLWNNYTSTAGIKDGHSDYSSVKFYRLTLQVEDDEVRATRTYAGLEGTMTIAGGEYSIIDNEDNILQTVSNQPQDFKLVLDNDVGDDYVLYQPMLGNKKISFVPVSGTGMNGVTVSWKFPDMPSLDGERILPYYKTPEKQLQSSLVPYFNLIIKKGNIEELDYGLAKAGAKKMNFSAPSDKTSIRLYADFNNSKTNFRYKWLDYDGKKWTKAYFRPKGFTAPVKDIKRIRLRVRKYDSDGNSYVYQWNFDAQ